MSEHLPGKASKHTKNRSAVGVRQSVDVDQNRENRGPAAAQVGFNYKMREGATAQLKHGKPSPDRNGLELDNARYQMYNHARQDSFTSYSKSRQDTNALAQQLGSDQKQARNHQAKISISNKYNQTQKTAGHKRDSNSISASMSIPSHQRNYSAPRNKDRDVRRDSLNMNKG